MCSFGNRGTHTTRGCNGHLVGITRIVYIHHKFQESSSILYTTAPFSLPSLSREYCASQQFLFAYSTNFIPHNHVYVRAKTTPLQLITIKTTITLRRTTAAYINHKILDYTLFLHFVLHIVHQFPNIVANSGQIAHYLFIARCNEDLLAVKKSKSK